MQWLYLGYLAGVKEQNGAAMSLGRTSSFLDIYFERDIADGKLSEVEAQEIIETLSRNLLALDASQKSGKEDPSLINEAFRAVHTLKGLAGLMREP